MKQLSSHYKYLILFGILGLYILQSYISTQFRAGMTDQPISGLLSQGQTQGFIPSTVLVSNADGLMSSMNINSTYVPPKTIVMWWGQEIPSGWVECNGENNTPDLRGRFPLAYNDTPNSTANLLGKTGGEAQVQLRLTQIPKHTHTGKTDAAGWGTGTTGCSAGAETRANNTGTHFHTLTTNPTGNNTPHENRPPYLALKFIMKLS